MKITTFGPMIATTDADPVVEVFRELGFERTTPQRPTTV